MRPRLRRALAGVWAGPEGILETIDRDDRHLEIAQGHFKAEGLGERIRALHGLGASVVADLEEPYDLIYFDTDPAESKRSRTLRAAVEARRFAHFCESFSGPVRPQPARFGKGR